MSVKIGTSARRSYRRFFMPCINPDGTLTPSAKAMLSALYSPVTLEEVAKSTGLPLFRIRSSIREMLEAGLVEEEGGKYTATGAGREKIGGKDD
jgi:predicted Rossmann fold nucleotide-binding protein DprA/Smf involved in DNA uptake